MSKNQREEKGRKRSSMCESEANDENEEDGESYESSESSGVEVNTLKITKENLNTVVLDKESYSNMINLLQKVIAFKPKVNKPNYIVSLQNEISLFPQINTQKNLLNEQERKKIENKLKELLTENEKLKKINNELLSKNSVDTKKIIDSLKKENEELKSLNENYKNEINKLNNILKEKEKKNKTFDLIKGHPKLLNNIAMFLDSEDKVNLSKSCHFLWLEIFYKSQCESALRKLGQKDFIIKELIEPDLKKQFKISIDEINNLLIEYLSNRRISGIEIRNNIVKSINFLNQYVKLPIKLAKEEENKVKINENGGEGKDNINEKEIANLNINQEINKIDESKLNNANSGKGNQEFNLKNLLHIRPGGKREKLFNQFSNFVNIIKGDDEQVNLFESSKSKASLPQSQQQVMPQNKQEINYYNPLLSSVDVLNFKKNELNELFKADSQILETYSKDNSLNVKFDFNSSSDIKDLINEFFNKELPKNNYQQFMLKICEVFSDLLFSCYLALKDIKHLEIIKHVLYCRFMSYKYKVMDLENELNDLKVYNKNTKEIQEILLKQKNEVVVKYTNSVVVIGQLNDEKNRLNNNIEELNKKIKTNTEKYELFKKEIIKEYKNIQSDFNLTKKERDLLKGTLIDFKNYFIKYIGDDGEIIEK